MSRAITAGGRVLLKDAGREDLLDCIRTVHAGPPAFRQHPADTDRRYPAVAPRRPYPPPLRLRSVPPYKEGAVPASKGARALTKPPLQCQQRAGGNNASEGEMTTMQEERFETGDGLSIFFRSWRPATDIRGVVVIVARLQLAQRLLRVGGRSNSSRGSRRLRARSARTRHRTASGSTSTRSPTTSATCAHCTLVKIREPGLPVFLLGHSAGGVVSCLYALDHQRDWRG